jgi:peptidoglycan/xylan/chitin deacetylase (PgdA/CDA1 family)
MRRTRIPTALTLALLLAACGQATQAASVPPATPRASDASVAPALSARPSPAPPPRPGVVRGRAATPLVEHGPRTRKRIALTFDADLTTGMRSRLRTGKVDSYYNADLIAVLRRLHVPATMFLTGLWMDEYPDVTRDLAADPLFELGTHSQTHRAFTAHCYGLGTVPPKEMLREVTHPVRTLDRLDDHATRYFRFPGGCSDATALRRTAAAGVTAIGTDLAGGDGHARSASAIADTVLAGARPGAVVTLHMHGGDIVPLTDEAVVQIVEKLRRRGYRLVTVSDLLGR